MSQRIPNLCGIINDKTFFSFMSGCNIDIGDIGVETAIAKEPEGWTALPLQKMIRCQILLF